MMTEYSAVFGVQIGGLVIWAGFNVEIFSPLYVKIVWFGLF